MLDAQYSVLLVLTKAATWADGATQSVTMITSPRSIVPFLKVFMWFIARKDMPPSGMFFERWRFMYHPGEDSLAKGTLRTGGLLLLALALQMPRPVSVTPTSDNASHSAGWLGEKVPNESHQVAFGMPFAPRTL